MKILLDECLDRRFADALAGHEVTTVPKMGWAGKKNGELLRLASNAFDVFVTVDKNLPDQQNQAVLDIAIVVLSAPSIVLGELLPLVSQVQELLPTIAPGRIHRIKPKT